MQPSNRPKGRPRLSGAGYKRQRLERDRQAQQGAAALQRFLVPLELNVTQPEDDEHLPMQLTFPDEPENPGEDTEETNAENDAMDHPDAELASCDEDDVEPKFDEIVFEDAGSWPESVPDQLRVELVRRGIHGLQNKEGPFKANSDQKRSMTSSWFYKKLDNGEHILRSWLMYSLSLDCLICFCCRLFGNNSNAFGKPAGFTDWSKLNPRVSAHEETSAHEDAKIRWVELQMRLEMNATIDNVHEENINRIASNWREILKRILDCIRFLCRQNLAFRGHREILSSTQNAGNFLELIKFLGKYDPVVREHLVRAQAKPNTVSYLSPLIQNEFISILGRRVLDVILEEVREAKYYAIIFDSTPDLAHVDQMSQVLRYVKIAGGNVEVKETFLGFLQLKEKNAEALTKLILEKLAEDQLDIQDIRGQGYDNAATMSGVHRGVQRRILDLNPLATYFPCNNHSLNLAGVHSAQVSVNATTFFGTLNRLFVFFSSSTHRWEIMKEHVPRKTVKRECETRWSSRYDAVDAVASSFECIIAALEQLRDGVNETADTRSDANILLSCLMSYTFIAYLTFWHQILKEVNDAQVFLQKPGLGLDDCATKLGSLVLFCQEEREKVVDVANEKTMAFCAENGIATERRTRCRRRLAGEIGEDAGLSLQDEVRREQLQIIDQLHKEMNERTGSIVEVNRMFGFLTNMEILMDATKDGIISTAVDLLTGTYNDISAGELRNEIQRLRRHINAYVLRTEEAVASWSALDLLRWVVRWGHETSFPNVFISLRTFLTMCVSVASCERSFSKLKLIKTYLRSSMGQERLSSLALLSIERDIMDTIDFDSVIDKFAAIKARRIKL